MIYADNAATTRLDEDAFEAMKPFLMESYGNPSQPYSFARAPKKAVREARETIARCIGADPDEIFFTSGFKNSGVTPKVFAAVYMTGILPIKKDVSQSAISDFEEFTMISPRAYAKYVGFTEDEAKDLCEEKDVNFDLMKRWYDGYRFKDTGSVYNPNSVMKAANYNDFASYWTETSAAEGLMKYISICSGKRFYRC